VRDRWFKFLTLSDENSGVGVLAPAAGKPKGTALNLFVLKTWLQSRFCRDERGANLVEYILLVALIALAVIAAVVFLRGQVSSKFDQTGSTLSGS
jgi:Flp pilus assembly pilin Flp